MSTHLWLLARQTQHLVLSMLLARSRYCHTHTLIKLKVKGRMQIPTRVELHIGVRSTQTADPDGCMWKRLGAIGFADNEQSHYCARELKSIGQLDEEAVLLKLVVLGAHQNALNKFNQASYCLELSYGHQQLHLPSIWHMQGLIHT